MHLQPAGGKVFLRLPAFRQFKTQENRDHFMNSAPKRNPSPQAFNSLAFDFSTTHALRKSMNRYRTLFESAGDPILVFDWEGRILDFNRIACRRLGYSRKTLGRKMRRDIERPDPTASGKKHLQTLHREGHVLYETTYLKRNGEIKAYSEPGKGTTFTIFLPRIQAHTKVGTIATADSIPKGSGRILLIDDEVKIIEVISQMLDYLGYRVTALSDSNAALSDFRRHPDRYDLVITDMTMPHMTGDVLARKLLAMRPNLPILLCTGYSRSITREKAQLMGIRDFIMKPPTISELARAIHRALQENPGDMENTTCNTSPNFQN